MATYDIPADWDISDPHTWTLETAIDANMGTHGPTGGTMREYQDIRHAATDYDDTETMLLNTTPEDAAQWWADVLAPIHQLACALGEASEDRLVRTIRTLGADPADFPDQTYADILQSRMTACDDLECDASEAERILVALNAA